jgi:hypothetical protein
MRNSGERVLSNVARGFFAVGYLVGSMVHVRFAVTNNHHVYEAFGKTALIPGFRELWSSVVMPNITFFALLLAVFEMTTTILILSRGKYVRIGLAASVLLPIPLGCHPYRIRSAGMQRAGYQWRQMPSDGFGRPVHH